MNPTITIEKHPTYNFVVTLPDGTQITTGARNHTECPIEALRVVRDEWHQLRLFMSPAERIEADMRIMQGDRRRGPA